MLKRVSLVWKHPNLSDARFRKIWLGEHATLARKLPGVREYKIDFAIEPPVGAPSAIATLCFDSKAACEAAFAEPELRAGLMRTRDEFAARVQILYVEEHTVIGAR